MTAAAAVEPTELEELMEAQAEAAHEREVGDATRPTAQDLAASPTRIDVEGLDLFYGDHHALKDVSIKIRDKQITSFIGPSGCGKSTLLRCFNRMNDGIKDCRIEGKIALDGQDILGDYDICRLRQRVGMVFQRPNPFPMSIYDNVAYGPRGMGVRDRAVLDELVEDSLRRAALWDEVKDKLKESGLGLSGGQQQRLCIARALAVQPDILLMDEPTSALDPVSTLVVEQLACELKETCTLVVVTHNMVFTVLKPLQPKISFNARTTPRVWLARILKGHIVLDAVTITQCLPLCKGFGTARLFSPIMPYTMRSKSNLSVPGILPQ